MTVYDQDEPAGATAARLAADWARLEAWERELTRGFGEWRAALLQTASEEGLAERLLHKRGQHQRRAAPPVKPAVGEQETD